MTVKEEIKRYATSNREVLTELGREYAGKFIDWFMSPERRAIRQNRRAQRRRRRMERRALG